MRRRNSNFNIGSKKIRSNENHFDGLDGAVHILWNVRAYRSDKCVTAEQRSIKTHLIFCLYMAI